MTDLKLTLAASGAALILGAALAWGIQSWRVDAMKNEFAVYRAVAEANAAAAEAAARAAEEQWASQLKEVNDEHAKKLVKATKDAAAARRASIGLRDTLAALQSRLAEASVPAVTVTAAAVGDVLGECEEKYRAMAATADGHAVDVGKMMGGWPRLGLGACNAPLQLNAMDDE
ncbi:MAG: hypothetical protein LBS89_03535 [Zoogloeaceae bacterium]|jgi:hypothetical protein|nr:hypothetical protein [Zoogloeaceae bacterium]